MKKPGLILTLFLILFSVTRLAARPPESATDLSGFVPIFDGKTLEGWHQFGDEPEGRFPFHDNPWLGSVHTSLL